MKVINIDNATGHWGARTFSHE